MNSWLYGANFLFTCASQVQRSYMYIGKQTRSLIQNLSSRHSACSSLAFMLGGRYLSWNRALLYFDIQPRFTNIEISNAMSTISISDHAYTCNREMFKIPLSDDIKITI